MVAQGPSVMKYKNENPPLSAEKRCALHVFTNVSESSPHITTDEVTGVVTNATARSKGIVYRDRTGMKSDGKLVCSKVNPERKTQIYEIRLS
jgi:hypothetical protein